MTSIETTIKRKVRIKCPACGGAEFSFPDQEPSFPKICVNCGSSYSIEEWGPEVERQVGEQAKEHAIRIAERIFKKALNG